MIENTNTSSPSPENTLQNPIIQSDQSLTINNNLNTNILGRRIIAAIIDLFLWVIIFAIAATFFGKKEVLQTNSVTTNMTGDVVGSGKNVSINYSLTGVPAVLYGIAAFSYYILLEAFTGKTLGKLLLGLKVAGVDGSKITFGQSVKRNLFRIVDSFPFIIPYLVGLVVIATSSNKQRLGDKVAKTIVIKN